MTAVNFHPDDLCRARCEIKQFESTAQTERPRMTDIDISPEAVERLRTSMRIGHSSTVDAERMITALSSALTKAQQPCKNCGDAIAHAIRVDQELVEARAETAAAAAEARCRRTGIATEKLERLIDWLKEDEDNVFLLPAEDVEKMRAIIAAIPQGDATND